MTPEQRRELLSREMEQSTGMSQRERELFNQCENLKAERDTLQARVDGALAALGETSKPALGESFWRALDKMVAAQNKAIEILTGEGES